jgi:hydroxymethylpyrimidine/phosphomethylpyrimidine kinase
MKIALTVAGSDSGGGAGIQADLKTFQQFGVYGTTVIVALTAQNTLGVDAVHLVPAPMVEAQFTALSRDLPPDALKTGMLATADLVRQVAGIIRVRGWSRYVLDPVMVATSGDRLLSEDAEAVLRTELIPLAQVVTPNLDEAAILTGVAVNDPESMADAGRRLLEMGAGAALIKGGHLPGDDLVDLLVTPGGILRFKHRRVATRSTHGTGCTLSAGLTAGLALGLPVEAATERALDYLQRAIARAPGLGAGHGPIDHSVPATIPSISPATRSPT